jgi:hypothetical protein
MSVVPINPANQQEIEVIQVRKSYFDVMNATIARLHIQLEDAKFQIQMLEEKVRSLESPPKPITGS